MEVLPKLYKRCGKCKRTKELSAFPKRNDRPCGRASSCKECQASKRRNKYAENPLRIRQSNAASYKRNAAKRREYANERYFRWNEGKDKDYKNAGAFDFPCAIVTLHELEHPEFIVRDKWGQFHSDRQFQEAEPDLLRECDR